MQRQPSRENGTFHPISYRAPHSGQMRMIRYTSVVDLKGMGLSAWILINDVWKPSSYPHTGQMRNSFSIRIVLISPISVTVITEETFVQDLVARPFTVCDRDNDPGGFLLPERS